MNVDDRPTLRAPDPPDPVELLLRMGLARRMRPFVLGNPEPAAERIARELIADLELIGFELRLLYHGELVE